MKRDEEYRSILGVGASASHEEIKRAFREKIKLYHPDRAAHPDALARAQDLIEAYNCLLNPPVQPPPEPAGAARYSRTEEYGARSGYQADSRSNPAANARAREYVDDILKSAFGAEGMEFRKRLLEAIFQKVMEESGGRVTPAALMAAMRNLAGESDPAPSRDDALTRATDQAKGFYYRAEDQLRNVVETYNRQKKHRARAHWARDYIRDLGHVQILFRDVANKHPSAYGPARRRVLEIQELVEEIRRMAIR